MSKKRVLLIGLDAAEWGIINPLIEAGMLPAIQKIISNGVSGNIKTLNPPFSPMLWTSIATGKTADQHGILGFVEPTQDNTIVPISSTSRKSKALWNILTNKGLKSNVISWWPSHPCEPINGIMVSNKFQKITGKVSDAWPVAEDSVYGLSKEDEQKLAAMRVHPNTIGVDDIKVFVPELASIDQSKDHRLKKIQVLLAEALSVKNATVWAMQKQDWDFTAVYFNELDQFSHSFMPFHPPYRKSIPEDKYQQYKNVMTAVYTFYDKLIEQLVEQTDENTYVILCSDHGFYADNRRLNKIPEFAAGIALEHNPNGVLCISGPDINRGGTVYHAGLLDIAPTVLSMLNLPIGKDMDGRALQEIYTTKKELSFIDSWETQAGHFGEHDKNKKKDPFSEQEALKQLIELGYVEKPDGTIEEQLAKCMNETSYNLSLVLASKGRIEEAVALVEKLYEEDLVDVRYNLDLIKYYRKLQNPEKARQVLSNFKKFDISSMVNFQFLEGKIYITEKKYTEALDCFKLALNQSPDYSELLMNIGVLYNKLQNYSQAEIYFKKILAKEPQNVSAQHGLTIAYNRSGKHEEAVNTALEAIKLQRDFAPAYYHLGEAFYRLGEYDVSAQALELALKISPGISRARNLLLNIYSKHLPDQEKYNFHHGTYLETRKGEVVVVSGLPRSGTSMMMQMLHAGGLDVLMDDNMKPDESNPKGYFEYQPVKNSRQDSSWMKDAKGKVVKVIAQLLPTLAMEYKLKVIFMERNLNEVVYSQNKMISLKTAKAKEDVNFDMRLVYTYTEQLEKVKSWAEERNNIEVLYVHYKDVIENPADQIREINHFLNWQLNEEAMKACITPDLYRVKF